MDVTKSIAQAVLKAAGGASRLVEIQKRLAATTVEGVSSGSTVKVTFGLNGICQRVAIDPSLLSPAQQQLAEEQTREAIVHALKLMTAEAPRIMSMLSESKPELK